MINRNGHCVLQIAPTGDTGKAYLGINFFENYYGIFDMDNQRVGFAESVYSDLSEHQSATHTNQILLNMSSVEKAGYFMEAAGFEHGYEIICGSIAFLSVVIGALIANCILNRGESDTKQARKALATVLNEGRAPEKTQGRRGEDDMFDVPLNDDRTYVGPDAENDMLTSETRYIKAASRPGERKPRKSSSKYSNVKVGNLTEDENYSFDVEL